LRTDQPNRATELARAVVARSNDPIALAVLALSAHRSGNGAQFQALATRLVLLVQGSAGDNDPERWVLLMLADEVMRAKERSPGARDPRESRLQPPAGVNRSLTPAEVPMGAGEGAAMPSPRASVR
jgi:hypothetical protein